MLLEESIVVQKALLPVESCPRVSALHQLLDEPLQDRVALCVVQTLNLKCCDGVWTLHFPQSILDLLRQLDLLAHGEVIFELDVHIVVATCDAPTHASEYLVKWINVESRSEVACSNEKILYLLEKLCLLSLSYSYRASPGSL